MGIGLRMPPRSHAPILRAKRCSSLAWPRTETRATVRNAASQPATFKRMVYPHTSEPSSQIRTAALVVRYRI